jgi:outer membrane biosynthesis protein TonB
MSLVGRGLLRMMAVAAVTVAAPACAQDNLQRGQSAAQIFASDCALCHKSPQGLAKGGGGLFGLQGFLREHYTTSRETAAMLAQYLEAAGAAPAAAERKTPPARRTAKPTEAKPAETKPTENKPSENKTEEAKPEVKPEVKPEPKAEPKTEVKPEAPATPKESSGSEIKSGIAVTPADKPAN